MIELIASTHDSTDGKRNRNKPHDLQNDVQLIKVPQPIYPRHSVRDPVARFADYGDFARRTATGK